MVCLCSPRTAVVEIAVASGVPMTRAATTRYVSTAEAEVRAVAAESPMPIAHTDPRVTTRISRWIASAVHDAPPASVNTNRNGRATARKAMAADHAAMSLPTTISWLRSAVACRSARVASARSPLMEVADRVGAMMSPIPRTKQTVMSYRTGMAAST